ncbi:MAG: hypothetical protein ACI9IP_000157 [Arcticibacterium sp.]
MKKIHFILLLFFVGLPSKGQFLKDTLSQKIVTSGLDKLYNMEFDKAEKIWQPVYQKYAGHPLSYLLKATFLQWKFMPVENNERAFQEYLEQLERCKETAYVMHKSGNIEEEANFYLLSAHGYISRAYSEKKDYIKAGLEAKKAYGFLKAGFELYPLNPDFLLTNGLYRYYRVQYPETHPQIKPIIYFFSNGDKIQGLRDLREATKTSLFTKTEAIFFLAGICLKYENNKQEALKLTKGLNLKFPKNPDFLLRYTESLIINGQFLMAEVKNQELKNYKGVDYILASLVFDGDIEFNKNDLNLAEIKYKKAIGLKGEGRYVDDFKSMAYLSLGQISLRRNNLSMARTYFKESLDIAEYNRVINSAKKALETL